MLEKEKINLLVIQHVDDIGPNKTRVVSTVLDADTHDVLTRKVADFEWVPLGPLAREYREFTEKLLRQQLHVGNIEFKCNILGPRSVVRPKDRIWWILKARDPETGEGFNINSPDVGAAARIAD